MSCLTFESTGPTFLLEDELPSRKFLQLKPSERKLIIVLLNDVCDFQPQILGGLTGGVRSHNLGRGSTTQSLMNGEYHFQEKCLRV